MFTPSRPAPRPTASIANGLPPHHPFATYYVTPMRQSNASSVSMRTLDSSPTSLPITPKRTTSPYSSYSTSTASCYSTASGDYRSSLGSAKRPSGLPTASLAAPLTPGRPRLTPVRFSSPATPFYTSTRASPTASPTSPPHDVSRQRTAISPAYSTIPSELAVLDRRPRENLLGDLEFIIGKKLRFPLLRRWTAEAGEEAVGKKEKRTLKKERRGSQEEEFGWEVEELLKVQVAEKRSSRNGRCVREGNWI